MVSIALLTACTTPTGGRRALNHGDGVRIVDGGRADVEGDSGVRISAGVAHTCVVRQGGAVWCWGANNHGQLGDGTTDDRSEPVRVPGLSGVVEVAAGAEHTCARGGQGDVVCWGSNQHGQVGAASGRRNQLTPSVVTGAGNAREIVAGARHTCARLASRQVLCWGDNSVGQLGDGTTEARALPDAGAAQQAVLQVTDAVELIAGHDTTCARLRSGRVACWGDNANGGIGYATESVYFAPIEVPNLDGAVALAGGFHHTCAMRRRAEPVCWGNNAFGQLDPDAPLDAWVAEVRGFHFDRARQIAAGMQHTCLLLEDGQVRCWGDNHYGQLGINSVEPPSRKNPPNVRDLAHVVQLAAGGNHTCALLDDGNLHCWGNNDRGQLGTGNTGFKPSPTRVQGLEDAVELVAGLQHTCAVRRGGEVVCWGSNLDGRAGSKRNVDVSTPHAVRPLRDVVQLAAGHAFTCALQRNGKVACWGVNDRRQLGATASAGRHEPATVVGLEGVKRLVAGDDHVCADLGNGVVRCWGDDAVGQLGSLPADAFGSPTLPPRLKGPFTLFGGGRTTCLLAAKGKWLCWGLPPLRGDDDATLADATPIPELEGAPDVWFGSNHACASLGGAIRCWGDGRSGQTGDGATESRPEPVSVSGVEPGGAVALGEFHTCAVGKDKRVRCWGSNRYGQLGDGTTEDRATPVLVDGLEGVASVVAGATHTCARTSRGAVFCWGQSGLGQLGDGSLNFEMVPRFVRSLPL